MLKLVVKFYQNVFVIPTTVREEGSLRQCLRDLLSNYLFNIVEAIPAPPLTALRHSGYATARAKATRGHSASGIRNDKKWR